MENKTYKLWVARDKNGFLFVYEDKPTRCDNQREWIGRFLCSMKNSYFPELKWEDEPIEVELRQSKPTSTQRQTSTPTMSPTTRNCEK